MAEVGGTIKQNTVWLLANSPYHVTQDMVINSDVTLNIEAGVVVNLDNGVRIDVNGTLIARGTANQKIVFQPTNGTTLGSWDTISFSDSSVDANWMVGGVPIYAAVPLSLTQGYNAVGIPHPPGLIARMALSQITGGQIITQWNAGSQMWRSVFKNVVGDVLGNDFEFEADQGYFISVNQNSTWVPTIVLAAPKKTVSLPPVLAMTDVTSLLAFSAGSLSSASAAFAFRSDGIGQGYVEYGTDLNLADQASGGNRESVSNPFAATEKAHTQYQVLCQDQGDWVG